MEDLTDVRYEVEDGLAWITIDRPEWLNAFWARTVDELIACFKRAWASPDVGVVCIIGARERAFCTGGDQKQRAETGDYDPSESFSADTEHLAGMGQPAFSGLGSFLESEEAREGVRALGEKRAPEFSRFRASVSA